MATQAAEAAQGATRLRSALDAAMVRAARQSLDQRPPGSWRVGSRGGRHLPSTLGLGYHGAGVKP